MHIEDIIIMLDFGVYLLISRRMLVCWKLFSISLKLLYVSHLVFMEQKISLVYVIFKHRFTFV